MQPSPTAETSRLLRPNLRFFISSSYSTLEPAWYCSSVTFSIQSTALPSRRSTMAMCVIAVVIVAPCQCFSPGGIQITSPGRTCSIGPPQRCARPAPAVTIRVWPSVCVCHAVRALGSNVTLAPLTRAGSGAWNSGSMRTVPVNQSTGPLPEGWEPLLLMSIQPPLRSQPVHPTTVLILSEAKGLLDRRACSREDRRGREGRSFSEPHPPSLLLLPRGTRQRPVQVGPARPQPAPAG